MSVFIDTRGLCFDVGAKRLVEDVTLDLRSGQLAVIVGPNGAGKSTLLKLLSGELRPTQGYVRYLGEPAQLIPVQRLARRRAVMTQSADLPFPFSVFEIARIGCDGAGRKLSRQAADAMTAQSLSLAGVLHLAERDYRSLSGGERRRAQFARVLGQLNAGRLEEERQALLLDEPISNLDLRHQLALMDVARDMADRGVAVLAVLHELNIAAAYADELIVMTQGRVVAGGRPAQVMTDDIVERVFGVGLNVGVAPPPAHPFILPQGHVSRRNWSRIPFSMPHRDHANL